MAEGVHHGRKAPNPYPRGTNNQVFQKFMLSVGEITLKNQLHWEHRICHFNHPPPKKKKIVVRYGSYDLVIKINLLYTTNSHFYIYILFNQLFHYDNNASR